MNAAKDRDMEVFLRLEEDSREVPLNDWLEKKQDMLEYVFNMRDKKIHRGKTLKIQDNFFKCKDKIFQVTREISFQYQAIQFLNTTKEIVLKTKTLTWKIKNNFIIFL